ncbi:protein of unknown function [Ruminococcaceae bacterium BL-6]|nr:protein of unknown function [Ruminococcaceae bacterium BL-6]
MSTGLPPVPRCRTAAARTAESERTEAIIPSMSITTSRASALLWIKHNIFGYTKYCYIVAVPGAAGNSTPL